MTRNYIVISDFLDDYTSNLVTSGFFGWQGIILDD